MAIRVLLVDDLSFMRMVQKDMLSGKGYDIVGEASDGLEAVEMFESLKPDIVLMDITMPNMNGLEAVKRIFADSPDAKIIICSAVGQQKLIMEAINSGIKDFIVKPFKADRLLSAMAKALE